MENNIAKLLGGIFKIRDYCVVKNAVYVKTFDNYFNYQDLMRVATIFNTLQIDINRENSEGLGLDIYGIRGSDYE
ncbi:MAG: hypothetical protein WA061_01895 [Microgenomates group bacterium]